MSKTETGTEFDVELDTLTVVQDATFLKNVDTKLITTPLTVTAHDVTTKDLTMGGRLRVHDNLSVNSMTFQPSYPFTYSQGTWTPLFINVPTGTIPEYWVQQGSYTRIGNKVTACFEISGKTFVGFTVAAININLPFQPSNPKVVSGTCSTLGTVTGRQYPYYISTEFVDGQYVMFFHDFNAAVWDLLYYVTSGEGSQHLCGTITYEI